MVILGLSWGVTSTAAVMIDGRIVACASEERYNKIKNYDTWPLQAIAQCLRLAGIEAKDVDYVVWGGHDGLAPWAFLTHRYCNFSVAERVREQEEYWYPKLYDQREVDYLDVFRDRIDVHQFPGADHLRPICEEPDLALRYQRLANLRPRMVELQLGLPAEKNVFLNHHRCHAYYAACALPAPRYPLLVFTLDGAGDRESATVSVFDGRRMEKLYGSARFTGGRYYRHATLLLGMKMIEHEYKVMGLAPYAKPYYADGPYQNGMKRAISPRPTYTYNDLRK